MCITVGIWGWRIFGHIQIDGGVMTTRGRAGIMIMQQGQKSSKKWVDFSDQSEEQFDEDRDQPALKGTQSTPVSSSGQGDRQEVIVDHRSEQFMQQQLKRFNDARQQYREIWVLLESEDQTVLDKKIRDLKENPGKDVINVYSNKDVKRGWDVKVTDVALEAWIRQGIDAGRHIRVTVSDRNFRRRTETGDRPRGEGRGRGGRGGRGGGRGGRGGDRNRGEGRQRGGDREGGTRGGPRRDPNEPKKVYVDKNTGTLPNNKVELQQKLIQEKERHYTKQEAQRVGEGLGNFRNKTKTDSLPPPEVRVEVPRKPRNQEEVKPWARKEKEVRNDNEEDLREKKNEYREKSPLAEREEAPVQQKKKKHYVRVDNLPEKAKEQQKEQKPTKKEKDLLSEDSN